MLRVGGGRCVRMGAQCTPSPLGAKAAGGPPSDRGLGYASTLLVLFVVVVAVVVLVRSVQHWPFNRSRGRHTIKN